MQPLTTFEILSARYPGQFLILAVEAAPVLGIAEQTVRNQISTKKFPVPTHKIGARRFVRLDELARYIDNQTKPKRKRGPHGKVERIEAERLGISVDEFRHQQQGGGKQ